MLLTDPTPRSKVESTVFVVDDEEPMRNALQRLFKAAGFNVELYASAADFLQAFRPDRRGCLVLDVMMPGMTGIELQAALVERRFRIPTLFLTGSGQIAIAVAAMKAGALDFIEKPFDNDLLVQRVRRALEHTSGAPIARLGPDEVRRRLALLTPREREVMEHIVAGSTSKMTGRVLGVSHRTIEIHRARIMEKTRAESLADLVRIALEASQSGEAALSP